MDHNTAYFHARVCEKQARSRIVRLIDENGNAIEDAQGIADMFIKFYENLLGTKAENLQPIDKEILSRSYTYRAAENQSNCRSNR